MTSTVLDASVMETAAPVELASATPTALLSFTSATATALTDDELIAAQRDVAEQRRILDASAAVLAAETQHRSRRELGHSGLAQRRGARSAEVLIQHVTGVSGADARTLVRVGTLVTQLAGTPTP